MNIAELQKMAKAYQEVLSERKCSKGKMEDKKKLDPVDPEQNQGDFEDREDKDIDNDGDVDSTDKYLHRRRKAVTKAVAKDVNESHFKVGQKVKCIESGMTGVVTKVDPEEKGKYYTVKTEKGTVMKYSPDELEAMGEKVEESTKLSEEDMQKLESILASFSEAISQTKNAAKAEPMDQGIHGKKAKDFVDAHKVKVDDSVTKKIHDLSSKAAKASPNPSPRKGDNHMVGDKKKVAESVEIDESKEKSVGSAAKEIHNALFTGAINKNNDVGHFVNAVMKDNGVNPKDKSKVVAAVRKLGYRGNLLEDYLDEATDMTVDQVKKLIASGKWEAESDIKPRSTAVLVSTSGNKKMAVNVRESLDEARGSDKPFMGTADGFNYAVNISGIDNNFPTKGFSGQVAVRREIVSFLQGTKTAFVGAKGKSTLAAVKQWAKENPNVQFYAKWKADSSTYKDDSVEVRYKK